MSEQQQPNSNGDEMIEESTLPGQDGNAPTIEMSENQDGDDENSGVIYSKQLHKGPHSVDFTVSSDMTLDFRKPSTWINKNISEKPSVNLGSASFKLGNLMGIADTYDRKGRAGAEGIYAQTEVSANPGDLEGEPGERLPKAKAIAEAGVGRAHAEFSIFEAEAKGPNASASAEASVATLGAEAMARAEIASASANAGPFGVKLGLGVDTGVSVGLDGVEAKFLGTGFSFGPKTSISFLGSEVSCSVM